jgi:photosystem II stability/assembly factor-like uncharacterized protein
MAVGRQVVVLVGTNKGVFFYTSDPTRRDWRLTGPHLSGWAIFSLLGDSRCGRPRIFAGTSHMAYGPTIRVSDDFGASWTQIEAGPRYSKESGFSLKRIWQITPGHSSEPEKLYAGVDEAGLFVSQDNGESWREVDSLTRQPTRPDWRPGGGGLCLHTIVVDRTDHRRLWVAISAVGVFRTDDGGGSWKVCNNGLARGPGDPPVPEIGFGVHKLAQDPWDAETLYLQAAEGVFRTTDGGESWSPLEEGLPSCFGFPLAVAGDGDLSVVPLDPKTRAFPGGRLRVYRLRRGSDRWEVQDRGLPETPHFVGVLRDSLAVDPLEPTGVYFGTTQGDLFYSRDAGDSWNRLPGQFSRITVVKTWVLDP